MLDILSIQSPFSDKQTKRMRRLTIALAGRVFKFNIFVLDFKTATTVSKYSILSSLGFIKKNPQNKLSFCFKSATALARVYDWMIR